MTKQEYIKYWTETSERDWNSAIDLFEMQHYLQSLFFAHVCLEKLCKATQESAIAMTKDFSRDIKSLEY